MNRYRLLRWLGHIITIRLYKVKCVASMFPHTLQVHNLNCDWYICVHFNIFIFSVANNMFNC
jgi:hypothetical protein